MHCRILNIGPDSGVHRSLMEFLEAEGLGTPQHIETGAIALDILSQLPESELPHIIVIPFRLPVLTGVDFIVRLRLHERLRSIPIFVWGPQIPADEIERIYTAGGAGVFPGQFNSLHLESLRQFCRTWSCTEAHCSYGLGASPHYCGYALLCSSARLAPQPSSCPFRCMLLLCQRVFP